MLIDGLLFSNVSEAKTSDEDNSIETSEWRDQFGERFLLLVVCCVFVVKQVDPSQIRYQCVQ